MKKTAKRAKSTSPSKRAAIKSKANRTSKPRASAKLKTVSSSKRTKLRRVVKKAATAAVLAAGMAAVGTAVDELNPNKKEPEAAPDESSRRDRDEPSG